MLFELGERSEMERYVDMAYQRDGEEPKRWAFCHLAQPLPAAATGASADAGSIATADAAPSWTPFADGTFYPASEFRLNSRAPLPFSSCLAVSRNHFNLEWLGERQVNKPLVEAVMVGTAGTQGICFGRIGIEMSGTNGVGDAEPKPLKEGV